MEKCDNLLIHQAEAENFVMDGDSIIGINTQFGDTFYAKSFVLTPGTFLHGTLHYGFNHFPGGRAGDFASNKLADALKNQLGLKLGRLKTGTPQRILGRSVDFSKMIKQDTENLEENFSFFDQKSYPQTTRKDLSCYLVKTTDKTTEVVNKNLHKSPMYQGKIKGTGTRYCPSFEDKIVRFPHHDTHTLYLEPEGEFTDEYYINGFSTSLPVDIQWEMLRSIPGLEKAEISRYAYAIEYDVVLPNQLDRSLSLKKYDNLFLAGQINGTSGYEEAGGQGLVAGLNAAKLAAGNEKVEIGRDVAYIGVMIDDLVTKDIVEPYRLFTSRAEHRLHLRQDSADLRLCQLAYDIGLLSEEKYLQFKKYSVKVDEIKENWSEIKHQGKTLEVLLRKYKGKPEEPHHFPLELLKLDFETKLDRRVFKQLIIQAHYQGYLEREKIEIQKLQSLENMKLPDGFDYSQVKGLRNEARAKLIKVKPTTMAQASRIDGVTPAELTILRIYLKKTNNNSL